MSSWRPVLDPFETPISLLLLFDAGSPMLPYMPFPSETDRAVGGHRSRQLIAKPVPVMPSRMVSPFFLGPCAHFTSRQNCNRLFRRRLGNFGGNDDDTLGVVRQTRRVSTAELSECNQRWLWDGLAGFRFGVAAPWECLMELVTCHGVIKPIGESQVPGVTSRAVPSLLQFC